MVATFGTSYLIKGTYDKGVEIIHGVEECGHSARTWGHPMKLGSERKLNYRILYHKILLSCAL